MSRYLLIDIGAGTMDILYCDSRTKLHYKAVVVSPVRLLAGCVEQLSGDLVVTGCEMGGGALTGALRRQAAHARVVMSASAAATIHHDPKRVRAAGIQVVTDDQADEMVSAGGFRHLVLADLDAARLETIVEGLGVPFDFDAVAVCAQDHGRPPQGVSALDFRHHMFRSVLSRSPYPHELLYAPAEIPPAMGRLRALARCAQKLPAGEVYVMDSGMAAILGASLDRQAVGWREFTVLDVATSHTVAAMLEQDRLAGFFEYHTHDVTLPRLEALLTQLAQGRLEHQALLAEGGHGAYVRKALGIQALQKIIATGPKRRLLEGSRLPIAWGAPLGDNMMTGAAGLLQALMRRRGRRIPAVYS